MSDDVTESTPTKAWPARHPCAFAALGCSLLFVLLAGMLWWGCAVQRRRNDERFAVAVQRILDPAPLAFDPADGVAPVLVDGNFKPNFEVSRANQAKVVAALAPLGEVKTVTLLTIEGRAAPGKPFPVRCRVEGARATRDVTFWFGTRELSIAFWYGLEDATFEP